MFIVKRKEYEKLLDELNLSIVRCVKKILYFIGVLLMSISLITKLCSCSVNDSNVWKDTHKVLGDGTYQIFNHTSDGVKIKGISNSKYHQCIVDEIVAMKEFEENLYVYGKFTEHDIYTIINLDNNKTKYYAVIEQDDVLGMTNINDLINSGTFVLLESYDGFDKTEKNIFDDLKAKQ